MKLPLRINYREMAPLPALDEEIRRRAAKFEQWVPSLMSCEVTLWAEANRRQQGHDYHLKLTARVPDREITVDKRHGTQAELIVRDAFDAMDRRLEDYVRRRRGQVKQHQQPPSPATEAAGEGELGWDEARVGERGEGDQAGLDSLDDSRITR